MSDCDVEKMENILSQPLPCGDNLRIIYKYNKPYGIRDDGGFLLFFAGFTKYSNQEERYQKELEQQNRLADYLLESLKKND